MGHAVADAAQQKLLDAAQAPAAQGPGFALRAGAERMIVALTPASTHAPMMAGTAGAGVATTYLLPEPASTWVL